MFFGIVVLIIGVTLLLQNLNIIKASVWDIVWPSLIIILGISLIIKKKEGRWHWCQKEKETIYKNDEESKPR